MCNRRHKAPLQVAKYGRLKKRFTVCNRFCFATIFNIFLFTLSSPNSKI